MIAKISYMRKKGDEVFIFWKDCNKRNVSQRGKREKKIRKEMCSVIKVGNGWEEEK